MAAAANLRAPVGRASGGRSLEPEWMDGAEVGPEEYCGCLSDLARVNRLFGTHRPTLGWIARAVADWPLDTPVTLLDVGYGHGDMLRQIHALLSKRGLTPDLVGIDINPKSAAIARDATPPTMRIEWLTGDAYALELARPVHFIVSAHVAHHMDDGEIVRFLRWQDRTAVTGWHVNDLERRWIAREGFRLLARAARWHPFIRHDGPLSVARSFTRRDWERLVTDAGLDRSGVDIRWHLPFRLSVSRLK
jgi:SAM-dependent methyltransferase